MHSYAKHDNTHMSTFPQNKNHDKKIQNLQLNNETITNKNKTEKHKYNQSGKTFENYKIKGNCDEFKFLQNQIKFLQNQNDLIIAENHELKEDCCKYQQEITQSSCDLETMTKQCKKLTNFVSFTVNFGKQVSIFYDNKKNIPQTCYTCAKYNQKIIDQEYNEDKKIEEIKNSLINPFHHTKNCTAKKNINREDIDNSSIVSPDHEEDNHSQANDLLNITEYDRIFLRYPHHPQNLFKLN